MYPWPSFGNFLFTRDESSLQRSDRGWNRTPSYARSRALGSASDNVVTMAVGSSERSFEVYLTPARLAVLAALVNTVAAFTDWERPTPDSRDALLMKVEQREWAAVRCSDGSTQKRIRTQVTLLEQ